MARKLLSAVTFTVTVLFLFALANARAPLDQPRNDVSTHDLLDSISRTTNTILLPSERPDTDPATVVELEPETNNEPKQPQAQTTTDEFEIKEVAESEETATEEPQKATLTMISFRPINRHYFPHRPSLLPFRQHRRRCHHQRRFKPWGPRREIFYGNDVILSSETGEEGPRENMRPRGPEISYGNDLILSTEREEEGRQDNMGRRAPGRFQNQGGPRFWVVRGVDMAAGRGEKLKTFRHRRHPYLLRFHRPRFGEDKKEFEERDHGHHHIHKREGQEEGGIFRGIRKFLNSHF